MRAFGQGYQHTCCGGPRQARPRNQQCCSKFNGPYPSTFSQTTSKEGSSRKPDRVIQKDSQKPMLMSPPFLLLFVPPRKKCSQTQNGLKLWYSAADVDSAILLFGDSLYGFLAKSRAVYWILQAAQQLAPSLLENPLAVRNGAPHK